MKANVRKIRKNRSYSEEFKRELVNTFESGKLSVYQLEKMYGVSNVSIYKWIYKFSIFSEKGFRIVEMKTSVSKKLKELEEKNKELERIIGKKQIKIDYLETMIDVAKEEFDVDIKKNFITKQSVNSEKKKKK